MAGILSAVRLKEAGLADFTVYEKADKVGGTWRENTYPGLRARGRSSYAARFSCSAVAWTVSHRIASSSFGVVNVFT